MIDVCRQKQAEALLKHNCDGPTECAMNSKGKTL